MFQKVLIANRGEIACRVIRTLRALGVRSVAVYSEADAHARHVALADEAVCVGPAPSAQSYLNQAAILQALHDTGAEAVHPGYGFLSENPAFAEACEQAGVVFLGPTADQMRAFGLKHTARERAIAAGVPLLPGTGLLDSVTEALSEAQRIGYPVMLKSTAGGGGIGMRLCRTDAELAESFEAVQRLSEANFKNAGLYLERFVEQARHVEVQIFGDGQGTVLTLGERDCSVQRRNQKVIEETPAPRLPQEVRHSLHDAARRLGESVQYRSAGTVEFIVDAQSGEFYFLEVNTRLQVEHGVTEMVTGYDLVEWMVRLGCHELAPLASFTPTFTGHSVQVRIYAEDAAKNFQPSSGLLTAVEFPAGTRCDTWVEAGAEVPPYYDPLVAKLIVHGNDRNDALAKLAAALDGTRLAGIETNLDFLRQVIQHETFAHGRATTAFLNTFHYQPHTIEVLDGGTQTTVQDWPGRIGYWAVGVPPSGPMDDFSFRIANRIVGNKTDAAGLEMTVAGPTLRFHQAATIALTGARMEAKLDGAPVAFSQPVHVPAGATLTLGTVQGTGVRTYLAVRGGLDVPLYLGSRSTFTLGEFGGHGGRALRVGDVLHLAGEEHAETEPQPAPYQLPAGSEWTVRVLYGPHGAPDFFTQQDIDTFFAHPWEVHYNSNRTGVRLIGPKPQWARTDGGEAGLHPSNIHDNAYAIGTVDFTGDMPILLGPDGPSLGGFVCPACVIAADLWKLGQLKAGDIVRFERVTIEQAEALDTTQTRFIEKLRETGPTVVVPQHRVPDDAVLHITPASQHGPQVVYRRAGDRYLLVEYGPLALDLNLRFRVHALMQWCEKSGLPGIVDLTPGIRSLQIHYDERKLLLRQLLDALERAEQELPAIEDMAVPTRIVHLPLSWEDPSTLLAIQKYMQVVRKDAPWCPSNIEFIRRINGLDSVEDVKQIVYDASYLVLGLGDVYLGAPVATPIDPRHRLVTTKYNPARTWTPQNAVGIGGAYLCIYGMEGPGGYQFVGRTLQCWNTYRATADFTAGQPWLLRFFDQIRWYPVSNAELLKLRDEFPQGKHKLQIEETTFKLADYNQFLMDNQPSIAAFKAQQQAAFDAERERWAAAGQSMTEQFEAVEEPPAYEVPAGGKTVHSHVPGSVWKVVVQKGQKVAASERLVILETMKMEIPVTSPVAGTVVDVVCAEGRSVSAGQVLCVIEPHE